MKELKNYQQNAIDQLMQFTEMFLKTQKNETIIFQSPTGSGKTITIARYIHELTKETKEDICFLWISIGKGELQVQSHKSVKKEIEKIAIKYKNEIKVKYSITENKKYTTEECCQECPAINKFLYINNLGQISPCTWVVSNYPEYKSELTLKNSNFTEIIKSQPIQKYLKYIKENQIKGCPVNRRKQ